MTPHPSTRHRSATQQAVWGLLALVLGCGEAQPVIARGTVPLAPSAVPSAQTELPVVVRPKAPMPPSGIESPAFLASYFEALLALEKGGARDVRLLQFGDSHTASDTETVHVRRLLTERFHDGGRGFLAFGAPWSGYAQAGISSVHVAHFESERGHADKGVFTGDGLYGLLGFSLEAKKRGATVSAHYEGPASSLSVSYLARPKGGSFDLRVDGVLKRRVQTAAKDTSVEYIDVTVAEGAHTVEARSLSDAPVRLFGVELDRETAGVSVEALGINGARALVFERWDEPAFAKALAHRSPSLVVLSYGTNESADETPVDSHMAKLRSAVERVRRSVPGVACMLHGPPDRAIEVDRLEGGEVITLWETAPRVIEIAQAERRLAAELSCAYWDALTAIGGPGTMATWAVAAKPLGREDRVHYTQDGYRVIGETFAKDLLGAYDTWKATREGHDSASK